MWVPKDTHMRFANDLEIRRKVISTVLEWRRYLNFVAGSHGDRTAFRDRREGMGVEGSAVDDA
jgi:hypothetical protein